MGVQQIDIGGLGALVRRPVEGTAQFAVVICPAHPECSDVSWPLFSEIDEALGQKGVPVVRFDYAGVGLSLRKMPLQVSRSMRTRRGEMESALHDTRQIISWVRTHISVGVVVCGYSWGSNIAMLLAASAEVDGLVSISNGLGIENYGPHPSDTSMYHKDFLVERHTAIVCNCLYVVGGRDHASPLQKLFDVVARRKDGGDSVSIEVVKQGTHELRGSETEVARYVADWLEVFQEDMADSKEPLHDAVVNKSEAGKGLLEVLDGDVQVMFDAKGELLGAIDVDSRVRGGCKARGCPGFHPPAGALRRELLMVCLQCGGLHTEHEDRGSAGSDGRKEDMMPVKVICRRTSRNSVHNIFHILLDHGANVLMLRRSLGHRLPPSADVMAEEITAGWRVLKDAEPVPDTVRVSDFVGDVTPAMILTRSLCKELHRRVSNAFRTKHVQSQLGRIEKSSSGQERRLQLTSFLNDEVYPDIIRKLGLGEKGDTGLIMGAAMDAHMANDLELLESWWQTERLLRNKERLHKTQEAINALLR